MLSPAIATMRPSLWALDHAGLVLRQNFGDHLVNLQPASR